MGTYAQIRLHIAAEVAHLMENRGILVEEVQKAIYHAETTGRKFINPVTGCSLTFYRPLTVTYWAEYSAAGEEFQLHNAYSHRMGMRTGGGLTANTQSVSNSEWTCNLCKIPLEVQTVRLQYMQSIFPINLPVCPQCSIILVSAELATGKLAEAEQALEDK